MLKFPLITINLKAYPQAFGEKAVELSEKIISAGRGADVGIALAPQTADLYRVTRRIDAPTFAQHVDPLKPGTGTGWLLPEAVKEAGAVGSLVNHSEHRLKPKEIEEVVRRLENLDLLSMVCAEDVEMARLVAGFKPHMVAVEPPELIGTGRSVSRVKPEVVEDTVKAVHKDDPDVQVLCGAGVSSGEDVKVALELGAEGVLIAEAVVKAEDPKIKMGELLNGALEAK